MSGALASARVPAERALVDRRVVFVSLLAVIVAAAAGAVAQVLTRLIWLVTNLAFYGRFSAEYASPAANRLGGWVIAVPVIGGIVVGLMARYGSAAIRGHDPATATVNAMPPGGPLDAADIQKFAQWIDDGMPETRLVA